MSDEATVYFPRKLVKEFILKYKELECLWNRECVAYKNKKKRHQAITQLTQLVQAYDPAATRVHILRKIDSLRACVRREFKKVTEYTLTAKRDEVAYVPQLWYYKYFSFLIEEQNGSKERVQPQNKYVQQQSPAPPVTEYSEEEVEEERAISPHSDDVKLEPTYEANVAEYTHTTQPPCTSKVLSSSELRHKRMRPRGADSYTGMDDEYDAIGMNVAAKLRYLPNNMRILAEKLISDVLFQAQTNGLTAASILVTPDPFH